MVVYLFIYLFVFGEGLDSEYLKTANIKLLSNFSDERYVSTVLQEISLKTEGVLVVNLTNLTIT